MAAGRSTLGQSLSLLPENIMYGSQNQGVLDSPFRPPQLVFGAGVALGRGSFFRKRLKGSPVWGWAGGSFERSLLGDTSWTTKVPPSIPPPAQNKALIIGLNLALFGHHFGMGVV